MKKIFTFLFSLALTFLIFGCAANNWVLKSIGEFTDKQFFSHGVSQDFTDYAKYKYECVDFSNNAYFTMVTDIGTEDLKAYIADFERSVQALKSSEPKQELAANYDFDSNIISAEDYFYIYDDPDYPEFGNYTVYLFDTETMMLYYFHNNV